MIGSFLSLAALPLFVVAADTADNNHAAKSPAILHFPVKTHRETPERRIRRRSEIDTTSRNDGFFYTIEITLGTPGQDITVVFDTGSSKTWVNPVCKGSPNDEFCELAGHFNGSSTFVDLKAEGKIVYGKGHTDFEYGYDFLTIGSSRISQQIFGVATNTSESEAGLMGLAPDVMGWESTFPMVIDSLAQQGFIKSRVFSMDIRGIESDHGALIFGGIDTKKFTGPLEKLPIVSSDESPDGATRYWVHLDGVSVQPEDGKNPKTTSKDDGIVVLLDSGTTLTTLPKRYVETIVEGFPKATAVASGDATMYVVDCSLRDSKRTVDFKFGDTMIHVPYDEIIQDSTDDQCVVLLRGDDKGMHVLGDSFLRAAYVVFDWDNQNVHIANSAECGSELVEFGSGPNAVPKVLGKCGGKSSKDTSESRSQRSSGDESTSRNTTAPPETSKLPRPTSTFVYTTVQTHFGPKCSGAETCTGLSATTEVVTRTVTYGPQTTGTYLIPVVEKCTGNSKEDKDSCAEGYTYNYREVTVKPTSLASEFWPTAAATADPTDSDKPEETGESSVPGAAGKTLNTPGVALLLAGVMAIAMF